MRAIQNHRGGFHTRANIPRRPPHRTSNARIRPPEAEMHADSQKPRHTGPTRDATQVHPRQQNAQAPRNAESPTRNTETQQPKTRPGSPHRPPSTAKTRRHTPTPRETRTQLTEQLRIQPPRTTDERRYQDPRGVNPKAPRHFEDHPAEYQPMPAADDARHSVTHRQRQTGIDHLTQHPSTTRHHHPPECLTTRRPAPRPKQGHTNTPQDRAPSSRTQPERPRHPQRPSNRQAQTHAEPHTPSGPQRHPTTGPRSHHVTKPRAHSSNDPDGPRDQPPTPRLSAGQLHDGDAGRTAHRRRPTGASAAPNSNGDATEETKPSAKQNKAEEDTPTAETQPAADTS